MKKLNSALCLLLCAALALGLATGCQKAPAQQAPSQQAPAQQESAEDLIAALGVSSLWQQELLTAAGLGLPVQKVRQETISGAEMAELLDCFVEYAAPDKLAGWQALYPGLRSHTAPLTRFDAMAALYLAAQEAGGTWAEYAEDFSAIRDTLDFPWDEYYFTEGLYSEMDGPKFEVPGLGAQYLDVACLYYTLSRPSPFSGEFPFAYDQGANSIHEWDAPSYAEGVLAVVRLLATGDPSLFPSAPATEPDADILTPELMAKASGMPLVTAEDHPQWTGFVLGWDGDLAFTASEKNIEHLADWGFNSVRVMADYKNLFDPKDVTVGKPSGLRTLDSLVAAAIQNDIHLNLCLAKQPGRDVYNDPKTFASTGEFDLYTNPEQQAKADAIWGTLAERYRDVPSAALSFCPSWEALNYNLSTGLPASEYTPEEVGAQLARVIDAIRAKDPDRLIVYEPTPSNASDGIVSAGAPIQAVLDGRENLLISYNFCAEPYAYAHMTADEGAHVDNNNHSMQTPDYPTRFYAADPYVGSGEPLTLDGCLPAGTVIDLYLEESFGGAVTIAADGKSLYTEDLGAARYDVGYQLSRYYPYAASDKCISVTLPQDAGLVTVGTTGGFNWCGMDVTLPEEYAVDRWWFVSDYDVFLGEQQQAGVALKHTSRVMVCPTPEGGSRKITIQDNVSYTTGAVREGAEANAETIAAWCKAISSFDGNCIVRIEPSAFSGVT